MPSRLLFCFLERGNPENGKLRSEQCRYRSLNQRAVKVFCASELELVKSAQNGNFFAFCDIKAKMFDYKTKFWPRQMIFNGTWFLNYGCKSSVLQRPKTVSREVELMVVQET